MYSSQICKESVVFGIKQVIFFPILLGLLIGVAKFLQLKNLLQTIKPNTWLDIVNKYLWQYWYNKSQLTLKRRTEYAT